MILDRLLHKRATKLTAPINDPPSWLTSIWGGLTSSAGVDVTVNVALGYSAIWRGINLIASDIAKVPLSIYRRMDDGGKERDVQHMAYPFVRRRPNQWMKAFDFKQVLTFHAILLGNGYARIRRFPDTGELQDLVPLDPTQVRPKVVDGALVYVLRTNNGEERIDPDFILHIKGLGYDGLQGYAILDLARDTIGLGIAMRDYGARFFANGAVPEFALERPPEAPSLSPEGKRGLRKEFEEYHQGVDKSHRIAVLQEGTKITTVGVDARRSQLMEAREHELREVANLLNLPPHKVGDTTRTSFASLEQENQSYLDEALDRWFCQWEEECHLKLLTVDEQRNDSHFFEFTREAIVRADISTQTKVIVDELNNGLLTENAARAIRNRPSFGPAGDRRRIPANIIYAGEDVEDEEPVITIAPEAPDEPSELASRPERLDAYRRLLANAIGRASQRFAEHAKRGAKKPDSFVAWMDEKILDKRTAAIETLLPSVAVLCPDRADVVAGQAADDLVAEWRDAMLLAAECRPAELVDRVAETSARLLTHLPDRLACRILRLEARHIMELDDGTKIPA